MDCSRAAHDAREAVNLRGSASGGAAFGESNPLQRIWREINMSSRHGILTHRTNLKMDGRIPLGLP